MTTRRSFPVWALYAALASSLLCNTYRTSAQTTPVHRPVTAHVVGFDGKPLWHAQLVVASVHGDWSHVVLTDGNGDFSVADAPDGDYSISRYSPLQGEPPMRFPNQTLGAASNRWQAAAIPVDILRIHVIDSVGRPIVNSICNCTLRSGPSTTPLSPESLTATTDANGVIRFEDRRPGFYRDFSFVVPSVGSALDKNLYDMTMPAVYDMTVMVRPNGIRVLSGIKTTFGESGPIF